MGIYSANRVAGMNESSVRPNLSYIGTTGAARAMYESTINMHTLEESMLMSDFAEVKGLTEGTILESELKSINENAVTDFVKKGKELLKKLMEKIKGIFKTVYAKLTKWFLRNGKAYVAMHRKTVLTKSLDSNFEIDKYRKRTKNPADLCKSILEKQKSDIGKYDVARNVQRNSRREGDYALAILNNSGIKVGNLADLKKAFIDKCFAEESTLDGSSISQSFRTEILSTIENGKKPIKDLKKMESEIIKSIKTKMNDLDKCEKKNNKSDKQSETIEYIRKELSGFQSLANSLTSAGIAAVKFDIKQSRAIVAAIVAYSPKTESALLMEMEMDAAADEVDDTFSGVEEIDPEDVEDTIDIDNETCGQIGG